MTLPIMLEVDYGIPTSNNALMDQMHVYASNVCMFDQIKTIQHFRRIGVHQLASDPLHPC